MSPVGSDRGHGEPVWNEQRNKPSHNEAGEVVALEGIARDVTGHKRVEERLRHAEARYRTLVERMPAVTYVQEIGGPDSAVYMSPQIEALTGYTPEECKDPDLRWRMVHPDERGRMQSEDERDVEPGGVVTTEYRVVHRDGRVVWVRNEAVVVEDEVGGARYWQGFMVDITELKRAERLLRLQSDLLEQSHDAVFMWKPGGEITYWNGGAQRLYGWSKEEAVGRIGHELLETEHPFPPEELERRLLRDGRWEGELVHRARDGRRIVVDSRHILGGNGAEPKVVLETNRDLTEHKRNGAESVRRARQAALRADVSAAVAESADLGTILDECAKAMVRHLDATFARVWLLDREEGVLVLRASAGLYTHLDGPHGRVPVGRFKIGLIAQERRPRLTNDVLGDPRIENKEWARREGMKAFAGYPLIVEDRLVGVVAMFARRPLAEDSLEALASVADTIAQGVERKALGELLEHQASHDSLTGLPNRRLFLGRLKQAFRRHGRRGGGEKAAVLFMDLDNFKTVNDSLGHEAGDELLLAVGERMRGCLRPEDTLARFGGDEFTVLVDNVGDPADAVRVAERIMDAHREPFDLGGQEVFVKLSIGIALGDADAASPEDLLRDADTAMYRAKKEGLRGYRVFEPVMYEQALRRMMLENDLRRAIERDELGVRYQPIFSLKLDRVVAMEALLRWEHPDLGTILPAEFVPLAEETGLIVPIGRWVLKEACRQAREWQGRFPSDPPLMMGVNLSLRQFQDPGLAEDVARTLRETGLEPSNLALEITESVAMHDVDSTVATLEKLKSMGVWLVIDDFGTGNGSLFYLTSRFKMDHLKIDSSFVSEFIDDPDNPAIVPGLIEFAHAVGLRVIAEGVETSAHLESLKEMGCELVQGNHIAKPLAPAAASERLAGGERAASG